MRRLALAGAFCLAAVPVYAQDKATIEKLNDAFAQAFNKGDMAGVAGMYTQDAYLMPPQADLVRGRDDIQSSGKLRASRSAI